MKIFEIYDKKAIIVWKIIEVILGKHSETLCLERLKAGGRKDNRELHGWMASQTQWTKFEQASGVGDG